MNWRLTWEKVNQKFHVEALQQYVQRANLSLVGPTFAYFTLLSLVPVLLSAAAVTSLVGVRQSELQAQLAQHLPANVMSVINPILESMLSGSHVSALSISALVAIWSVSRILAILRTAFNGIYDVPERVNNMLTRVFSFLWLLVLLVAALSLMVLHNVLNVVVDSLPINTEWLLFVVNQGWLITLVGLIVLLTLFNWSLPAHKPTILAVVIGSAIQALLLIGLNAGFSWYAQIALKQVSFYQTLGSLIVLIVYLNLLGTLLVAGQILIAWIQDLLTNKADKTPPMMPTDSHIPTRRQRHRR